MKITFVLPGDSASGGTRVTMEMGNCLLERGHDVRIAYRKPHFFSFENLLLSGRMLSYRCQGLDETGWVRFFKGPKETFIRLDDLEFGEQEIVIATSPDNIPELRSLSRNIFKVGFCHGLLESEIPIWKGLENAIAVSPVLVPLLEQNRQTRILGVVPNGIHPEEYFVENRSREGIGFLFRHHPTKGPEVAMALVKEFPKRFPGVPCLVFGSDRKWSTLSPCEYTRYPSVAAGREIYNRCKVWLILTQHEGFCLPILEAMACGAAVVSSNHVNASELIQDGVTGFIVPYGDVNAYLQRIERLLADELLRETLVKEGFKTVKRFSWKEAADRMEEVLAKLKQPAKARWAAAARS